MSSEASFALIDAMSPDLRSCVHEFGLPIVTTCVQLGVTEPRHIRELVHTIWLGARQSGQRTPRNGASRVLGTLDWVLLQCGAEITARCLTRVLWQNGCVIVPREPGDAMIEASLNAMKKVGRVTREQKHRLRLRDAILAAATSLWPQLRDDAR